MRVWALNLDAELELEFGAGQRSQVVQKAIARQIPIARRLLSEEDVLIGEPFPAGTRGRCWCPTEGALQRLRDAGAVPEPAPSMRVLREANGRLFCARLGPTLRGARFVDQVDSLDLPPGRWRLKRPWGFAGRGQRTVDSELSNQDRDWIRSSTSGLQVEPEVLIRREVSTHGFVSQDGQSRILQCVEQHCSHGTWQASSPLTKAVPDAVGVEAKRVGTALADLGYFGPYGVDAYEYDDGGVAAWNVRSEINARYTMSYPDTLEPRSTKTRK